MLARRVDALVVASAQWTVETFRWIEEQKTPYVLIDRQFADLAANFVGVDDRAAGDLATGHLIETGCRRIAHIGGPEVSTAIGRAEGYRRALARHGLTPPAGYVIAGGSADDAGDISGYEAMRKLLALAPVPDGVFCYNDPVATGAMKAILESGLRIPQERRGDRLRQRPLRRPAARAAIEYRPVECDHRRTRRQARAEPGGSEGAGAAEDDPARTAVGCPGLNAARRRRGGSAIVR